MASGAEHTKPTAAELADLSALADGTLERSHRAAVEARIVASPELSALYERERRVVAALHQARASERAPAALRARIEAARPKGRAAARRRIGYAAALAGALAAVALALVLALPGGTPGAPSVSDAAALAARGPNQPAPAPDPSRAGARLRQNVGDVYFPNWAKSFGWQAVGARTDQLNGRKAVTVYYQRGNQRVAYTILDGHARRESAASAMWLNRTKLWTVTQDGRVVVSWRRGDDTCVLVANGVMAAKLQKLAAWSAPAGSR